MMTKTKLKSALDLAVSSPREEQIETNTDYTISFNETSGELAIIIQGSCDIEDWIQNFDFKKLPIRLTRPNGKKMWAFIHSGFYLVYIAIAKDIQNNIEHYGDKINKIKVTGYSHGAGASLATYICIQSTFKDFIRDNNIELSCPVFGCPRVFGIWNHGRLKREFAPGIIRVTNGNDIVHRVPYVWLGYLHIGKEEHIGEKRSWWKFFGDFAKDHILHSETGYYKTIEAMEE